MAEPVSLQTILTYLTLISVPVGVFYHIMTLRNTKRNQELARKAQELTAETRQAQLFMNIYNTYASKQYQKDRERILRIWEFEGYQDFFMKYGPEMNPDDHAIFDGFTAHFEGIAVLVKRGLIDPNLVFDLMYGSIIAFWDKFEPVLLGLREMSGSPKTLQDLESLYLEMKRLEAEAGASKPGIYSTPFIEKADQ